jgi:hypothetical protein
MSRSAARLSSRRRCTSTSRTSPAWLEHEVSVFTEHHVIKRRVVDSALRRAPVRHKPCKGLIVARSIE